MRRGQGRSGEEAGPALGWSEPRRAGRLTSVARPTCSMYFRDLKLFPDGSILEMPSSSARLMFSRSLLGEGARTMWSSGGVADTRASGRGQAEQVAGSREA